MDKATKEKLKRRMREPLTDEDLTRILGKNVMKNVIKYAELEKYNSLEELLPNHNSFKIILIEYEKNRGHWICIIRYNKVIELFNSYGSKHGDDDFVDSESMNYYLGQSKNYLNIFIEQELKNGIFNVIYNKTKFQKESKIINNCGHHVINRIICLLYFNMSLKDYIAFMKKASQKSNLNYDELVVAIIK